MIELIAEGFELLRQRMLRGQSEDPVSTLRQSSLEYLNFSQDEPHYYRLMFQLEDQELNERCRENDRRLSESCFLFLTENIGRLREAGKLGPHYSDLTVAHLLWSGLHGAACLALTNLLDNLRDGERAVFFEHVVERLVHSLTAG